jgi:hypothetical protein
MAADQLAADMKQADADLEQARQAPPVTGRPPSPGPVAGAVESIDTPGLC